MTRSFTGRHMAAILVAFFGAIVAVNFSMAAYASSTFGGIVVENSYVASQQFNRWLDQAEAERALGWGAVTAWRPDGRLAVTLTGVPANAEVTATARHPLGRAPDREFTFDGAGNLRFVSREVLPEERWLLRLEVTAGGRSWRREEKLP
jgi:nitrogen fixation protein FixH